MKNINRRYLDTLYSKYNKSKYISPDPLQFVHKYKSKKDREIVALISACFAYGNVKQILKTLEFVFSEMKTPYDFILNSKRSEVKKIFSGFKYRFTKEHQLCNLIYAIQMTIKKYGSLEKCFISFYNPKDKTILPALKKYLIELRQYDDINTLVSDPLKNSALKRMNLFLRWVIRKDDVDLGIWNKEKELISKLIIPLDTHIYSIAKQFNFTKKKKVPTATLR